MAATAVLQVDRDTWDQAGLNMFRVADDLGAAGQAARQALPFNAFGLLCSPLLLPIYHTVETAAAGMLASAQAGVERAGRGVRAAA